MLETVGVMSAVIIAIWGIWIISYFNMKHRRKTYIRNKFGTVPKRKELNENVRSYYDVTDMDGIDDVTWADLSMDEVFLRIDQCDTSVGEEVLYRRLRRNQMTQEERQLFERRVRMFSNNTKEREEIEYLLCVIGKGPSSYCIPAYLDSIEEYLLKNIWVYRALQVLLAVAFVSMIIMRDDRGVFPFVLCMAINLGVYTWVKTKQSTGLYMAGTAVSILKVGKKLTKRSEIKMFFPNLEKELAELKGVLRGARVMQTQNAGGEAGDFIGIILEYLTGITLCQVTAYNKVMRRLQKHVPAYFAVYECIGEIDTAVCTASLRKNIPWYCIPEETEQKEIYMEEVYHLLIKDPIANSLHLEKGCLITGSNASGKSTFIKAVAVNAIIAQALNTCAAKRFIMPRCHVITSMAVKDDLMAGESYFIREIRYLKRILDDLDDETITLCAIDEILRGTNTGERIRASRAILEYLEDKNCIPLVATHDKELTELLGDAYSNYHFSEDIREDDIQFSYRLEEGPAVSQNAVKLLEFAGFPQEIIEASRREV